VNESSPLHDAPAARLTPAQLQVLISRLTGIAEEMSAVLQRSSFSPNIKERADCSSALFTPEGELLVQAENIPVHLGSMPASVQAVIGVFGGRTAAGDQYVVNDPFAGGTHLNDITVVAPCLVDDRPGEPPRLVGWAANRAHHADVGGSAPGSIPANATEIFEEGLRIPPMRLTGEVRAMLLANSRTPVERAGDLDAQVGANVLGVRRHSIVNASPRIDRKAWQVPAIFPYIQRAGDIGTPAVLPSIFADKVAALTIVYSAMAALLRRPQFWVLR
jgi:N-methylhydantoinase B/oxoprolinase/acetone carboxylase alpha subunit